VRTPVGHLKGNKHCRRLLGRHAAQIAQFTILAKFVRFVIPSR
jgi:hypothetical protein